MKLILLLLLIGSVCSQEGERILLIHGGAGDITPAHGAAKKLIMIEAIRSGYRALLQSDNPMDAVEAAIRVMEDSPAFNAGRGGVLTKTGEVELDAIIINGTDLTTGAVGAVRHVKNPISLARLLKDKTDHVFLVGHEAELFALDNGITLVPTSALVGNYSDMDTKEGFELKGSKVNSKSSKGSKSKAGTVGAVAINSKGQICAGTSTGGMSGKMNGRIGDAPIVGAGTLADDLIAGISATGWGEVFIRFRVASRVADLIERGRNASEAISTVLEAMVDRIPDAEGAGGVIAITKSGDIGYVWNSEQMAWAYSKGGDVHYGVDKGEDITAPLDPEGSTEFTTSTTPAATTNNSKNASGSRSNELSASSLITLTLMLTLTLTILQF